MPYLGASVLAPPVQAAEGSRRLTRPAAVGIEFTLGSFATTTRSRDFENSCASAWARLRLCRCLASTPVWTGGIVMRFKLWLVAVAALIVIALPASASAAGVVPLGLSPSLSNAQVLAYLQGHGADPSHAIIQRGLRNYAGPNCPGTGWTCTKQVSDVVQLGPAALANPTNVATCIKTSCDITQTNTSADNIAYCVQGGGGASATQQCTIDQTNSTGNNVANVGMVITQLANSTEQASQTASIDQENVSGNNTANLAQQIEQALIGPGTTVPTQDQEGTSSASVTQNSTSGNNNFNGYQQQQQSEYFNGSTTAVSQNQDDNFDGNGISGPNESVVLVQNGSPGTSATGQDNSALTQLIQQNQAINNNAAAPGSTQAQGASNSGLDGSTNQFSSGVASENVHQNELQVQQPQDDSNITQTQFGPLHCCSEQVDNGGNTFQINQQSAQQAGPNAVQSEDIQGTCQTSGTCTVSQQVIENGETTTNSCSSSSCDSIIQCAIFVGGSVPVNAAAAAPSCVANPGVGGGDGDNGPG
jgi:hypothetical protein